MTCDTLPVLFRADLDGEVTAVFPTLPSDVAGQYFTVYAHVGQYGSGGERWLRTTRPATEAEAADLLEELRGIYTSRPQDSPEIYGEPVNLVPVKRRTAKHREEFHGAVRRVH